MGALFSSPGKKYKAEESTEKNSHVANVVPVEEEEIVPEVDNIVSLENIDVLDESKEVATYCIPLVQARFCGQTSAEGHTDEASITEVLNLGLYMRLLDKFLKQFDNVTDFTGKEEEYVNLLRLVATKRHREEEDSERCFQRLLKDSERFVKIYHKRGIKSETLETLAFWGSRQQLLSGKVIADWVDKANGPLDPLFGVLLQPTSGRVGPGDTGWFHNVLFDDEGHMAYHSAVHDAFGYLLNYHNCGPGYDYLKDSYFDNSNPLAGQIGGMAFWRQVLEDIETKQTVIKYFRL